MGIPFRDREWCRLNSTEVGTEFILYLIHDLNMSHNLCALYSISMGQHLVPLKYQNEPPVYK